MNLSMAIEEIIAAHPTGVQRSQIEHELRKRQVKGSSTANVKRILAQLDADNRIFVEGKSVARIYKPAVAGLDSALSVGLIETQVVISNDLLDEVKRKARSLGMFDLQRPGDFIDAVLRDWVCKTGTPSPPELDGHVERVQWVLNFLRGQAENGRVGPVGAKRIASEISDLHLGRKLSPSFVRDALKELVATGKLEVEVDRTGPVGRIYRIR